VGSRLVGARWTGDPDGVWLPGAKFVA